MTRTRRQVHGLVVSGGGAHAAYGVGVMKALFDGESPGTNFVPLVPSVLTGTSGGAINLAILLSQIGVGPRDAVRRLEQLWVQLLSSASPGCGNGVYRIRGNPFRYINPCLLDTPWLPFTELSGDVAFFARRWFEMAVNFALSSGDLERRLLDLFDLGQLVSAEPIIQNISRMINLEAVRRSRTIFKVVTTNWLTGELFLFGNADLTDDMGYQILLASAAIPGFFPPHDLRGVPFVDGGLVMNVPLMPAIDAGADVLHVTYFDADAIEMPLRKQLNTYATFDRARVIDWATRMDEDIKTAQWINQGLDLFERVSRGEELPANELKPFVAVIAKIHERRREGRPYRKLTIHRYHPRQDPLGALGILDFSRDQIQRLIARGFEETVTHDCHANHCVLPDSHTPLQAPIQRPSQSSQLRRSTSWSPTKSTSSSSAQAWPASRSQGNSSSSQTREF